MARGQRAGPRPLWLPSQFQFFWALLEGCHEPIAQVNGGYAGAFDHRTHGVHGGNARTQLVGAVVAANAGLNHIMARSLESACGCEISECSFKAAMRFFDLRMALGTSVIDAEAMAENTAPAPAGDAAQPSLPSQDDLLGRILRACPEDPLTYTDMSKHLVRFRKDGDGEERRKLLTALAELGLCECRTTQARGEHARQFQCPPIKFVGGALTPQVRDVLAKLKVPVSCWPERPLPVAAGLPLLSGAGKQARRRPAAARGRNFPAVEPALAAPPAAEQRAAPLAAEQPAVAAPPAAEPKYERCIFFEAHLQRAPDVLRVEVLVNEHLTASGPSVGDGPIQIYKASRRATKKGCFFQLRCFTCDSATCTWSGRAEFKEGKLQASELAGRHHGEPKKRKKASGRKPRGHAAAAPPLAIAETLNYEGEVKQNKFQEWVVKYFADKPLQQSLRVLCKPRPAGKENLVCIILRGTHSRCPWRGQAILRERNGAAPQIALKYCRPESHSQSDRAIRGTLTWQQRQVIVRSRSVHTPHIARDLKRLKRETDAGAEPVTPPEKEQLHGFMHAQPGCQGSVQAPFHTPKRLQVQACSGEALEGLRSSACASNQILRFVFIPTDKPHVLLTDHTVFFAAASEAHGTITCVSCAHTANFIVLLAGVRCRDAWWNMPMPFTTSEAYHFWFLIRGMCETCKPTHMLAACAVQLALTGTNCPCKERKFHMSLPSIKT